VARYCSLFLEPHRNRPRSSEGWFGFGPLAGASLDSQLEIAQRILLTGQHGRLFWDSPLESDKSRLFFLANNVTGKHGGLNPWAVRLVAIICEWRGEHGAPKLLRDLGMARMGALLAGASGGSTPLGAEIGLRPVVAQIEVRAWPSSRCCFEDAGDSFRTRAFQWPIPGVTFCADPASYLQRICPRSAWESSGRPRAKS